MFSFAMPDADASPIKIPTPADLRALIPDLHAEILRYKAKARFREPRNEVFFGQTSKGARRILTRMHYDRMRRRLWKQHPPTLEDLEEIGLFGHGEGFIPLIDLGAMPLEHVRDHTLSLGFLRERGVKEIALMEDRDPLFFLNFVEYSAQEVVPLNRHGAGKEKKAQWTMRDMKTFVDICHAHDIKVFQGFWATMLGEENNPFLRRNKVAIQPVIIGSDDTNPLSMVQDEEGREMLHAEYVIRQYNRLVDAFGIDGLFLGDGYMGYRSFMRSNYVGDFRFAQQGWEMFYALVGQAVHARGGQLMAYDVMGRTYEDAHMSGVDYKKILPHIDKLFVQTYGQAAWNRYFALPGYTLGRDVQVLQNLHEHLPADLQKKLLYTAELGDKVEGWTGTPRIVRQQFELQHPWVHGILGVWSNDILHRWLTRA